MPIRQLPPLLVNQIAAGEVIERPASVVKELVENSLDAGATRIDITIEDGGRQCIRVSDNGQGIAGDEMPLAVAPHATSKIDTPDQLASVGTLGFRGEALASIASVSRLRITSRPTDAQTGEVSEAATLIEAAGEHVGAPAPAAGSPGTVTEVRDLFFNTPARRKFLRAASTEFGHIHDAVQRLAMVWHDVAWRLTHNDRAVLDQPAVTARASRVVGVLGQDLRGALLEFEHDNDQGAAVWGMAGQPSIARATTKSQYVCLNHRPIRDRGIAHALREAYRGLIPHDRHPVVAVFLEVDPSLVDVNVHPCKAEVRFHEPNHMHRLVLNTLRQTFLGADLTPAAMVPGAGDGSVAFENTDGGSSSAGTLQAAPFVRWPTEAGRTGPVSLRAPGGGGGGRVVTTDTDAFVDYFRRMDPHQKGFVYQQVKRAMTENSDEALMEHAEAHESAEARQAVPTAGDMPIKPHDILQVHKSYVVMQDEWGVVIIDQHALHERAMFEQLRHRVLASPLESQRLLVPATVPASPKRQALLEDLESLLTRIGIEVCPIGPESVAIHAFPSFLFDRNVEPAEFVTGLLDKAEEGEVPVDPEAREEDTLNEVLSMMACKAAVKAGDRLTDQELAALLAQRDEIERASACPHGRPTSIRLSLAELDKQFKRT